MTQEISASLRARLALERIGFAPTHSLGQNFILDDSLIGEIARLSGAQEGTCVLEVGPGTGLLTRALALRGARVLAVELDTGLQSVLDAVLEGVPNVSVVYGDVMRLKLPQLLSEHFGSAPFHVVSNLPYYITADFVQKLLTAQAEPESMTLMVQSEAADRLLANPGDESWCALAAICAFCCERQRLLDVPRDAFTPPPHVDSALIRFEKRAAREVGETGKADFIALIKSAFAMRRKTLVNNLSAARGLDKARAALLLEGVGLNARVRGEELTVSQLAAVFEALKNL